MYIEIFFTVNQQRSWRDVIVWNEHKSMIAFLPDGASKTLKDVVRRLDVAVVKRTKPNKTYTNRDDCVLLNNSNSSRLILQDATLHYVLVFKEVFDFNRGGLFLDKSYKANHQKHSIKDVYAADITTGRNRFLCCHRTPTQNWS